MAAERHFPHGGGSAMHRIGVVLLAALIMVACGLLLAPSMAGAAVGGSIHGTVTDTSHAAIKGASVCAYEVSGEELGESCEKTNTAGEYTISGLTSGKYVVGFYAHSGGLNYITQYYEDEPSFGAADEVSVTTGATTSGIDAEMEEGGEIEGLVTAAVGGTPIEGVEVCALEPEGEFSFVSCALTNASGEYMVAGLPTGKYRVEFWASGETLDYITQYYNDKPSLEAAGEVSVTVGAITHSVDAAMAKGAEIKGTVTDASSHVAIDEAEVCALQASSGSYVRCTLTDPSGAYTLAGLPTGSYKVEFWAETGSTEYLSQFYDNRSTFALADAILLSAPQTATGIDAQMARASTLWPASTVAPQLSGTPMPGGTLFCSTGSWANSPTSYAYVWVRNGLPIAGQSASTYVAQSTDLGAYISCQVTAFNARGKGSVTSNSLQIQPASSTLPGPSNPTVKRCRKGFKKKLVHGRTVCRKARSHAHKRRHKAHSL